MPATILSESLDLQQNLFGSQADGKVAATASLNSNVAASPSTEPVSWAEWEPLLALIILERSDLGPPTWALLARTSGIAGENDDPLNRLEHKGLIQRLPPSQTGGRCRYTLTDFLSNRYGIQRPADLFIRATMNLLLRDGKNEGQTAGIFATKTPPAKNTFR